MAKHNPYTLFISDLHLQAEVPETTKFFFDFLAGPAQKADALYILGDFFEVWVGDDAASPFHKTVIQALNELHRLNIPLYFMRGNRDFLISDRFAKETGCQLLPDPSLINLYGIPTLLKHGDDLCTDDLRHQRFRRIAYHKTTYKIIMSSPTKIRLWVADKIRKSSRRHNRINPEYILDVNEQAVKQTFIQHGVTRLIHGHTHKPQFHQLDVDGQPAQRIVLGAWHDSAHALIAYQDGRLEYMQGVPSLRA